MRAVEFTQVGGPDVLRIVDHALPPLASGEARVRVDFAGVNFWDIMQRRGEVPAPPNGILGGEGSGRVIAIADDVRALEVGDKVAWSKVKGSYAEEVQSSHEWFVPVPQGVSMAQAAASLGNGTTAWYLSEEACPLTPGSTALVLSAAGGVGHLLSQLLTARGVSVIGLVSTEEKRQFAASQGIHAVLVDSPSLADEVFAVQPAGCNAVFDANGGPHALRDLALLAPKGHVVYYGTASGPLPSLDLALLSNGSLTVSRVRGQDFLGRASDWRTAAHNVLLRIATSELRVHVDQILPLGDAPAQHARLESRASMGKLLLSATSP